MTDDDFQDLKRENFNLKLRIYFLEEQNQISIIPNEHQSSTTYIQQLQNEIEGLRRRLQSQTVQPTPYNFDSEDERRALREELEKYRRENEYLRKSLQSYSNEREQLATTTTTSASIDSGLDTVTPGMSSTFISSSALQFDLNECRERERKLKEEIISLRKQLESSRPHGNETLAELDRARQQIQQYEADLRNYEQRQTKAERVLQRLQAEYESRIAHLVEQQQQQTADFEAYRHEPLLARIRFSYPVHEQTSPNVNIEEYRQAIDNRDRIIQQLEEAINEITIRLRTPFTLMLTSNSSTSDLNDERSQNLIDELNKQMKTHLEIVDQLRAECIELRRGETHLRNQIDSLTHLINPPTRNTGLPPLPRPSSKLINSIEDAQQVEDLQTAVVQITLQLQSDAENVSGLTNRVAQIIRDRDEWQDRINRLQEEIDEKDVLIRQLERREPEVESRIRQQYTLQIEILQRDIKTLQEQLKDRDRLINDFKIEKDEWQIKIRKDYEKFDGIHIQEKENLYNQLKIANGRLVDLEQQLIDERRRYDELVRQYEKIKGSNRDEVEQMEHAIQQQRIHIEDFNRQIREMENSFQLERRQLERERDYEKEKNIEIQNGFELSKRRFTELQTEYDRLQSIFDEQHEKFEQQIRIHQNQISQFNRDRGHSDDELESLKRENQAIKERSREIENKIIELTRKNDEFKSQISVYEVRFHDNEDVDKRNRNEINKLQRDIQEISRENEDHVHEINEWKRKYEIIKTDLNNSRYEKEQIESDKQTFHTENNKLKRDIDELEIQIRLQIQEEYETQYRQLISGKDKDVQTIQKDNEDLRYDLEQLNIERTRLGERLQSVENHLQQANKTIETYETDMERLRQALKIAQEKNNHLEQEMSGAYTDELKMKTDRLQDLEHKYRLIETQLNQYEKNIYDLRQENSKLHQYNDQLQQEYNQYRIEQQNNIDILQRDTHDAAKKNLTAFEERVRIEVIQATENKQELINRLENELREKDKTIKDLQHARSSYVPKDLKLELEIKVEELEQVVETKERFIKNYSETIQEKEQQIEKLLDDLQQGDNNNTLIIGTLREEIRNREKRIDQILEEKYSAIHEFESQISDLQSTLRDREREIAKTNDKLQQSEQNFDIQRRELEEFRQKRETLTVELNLAIEEGEARLDRIRLLEKQLEMSQYRNSAPDLSQSMIDDLKSKLRQRDDSIQSLQRTIGDSDRDLRETRQHQNSIQSDYNRAQLRYEQMEKQHAIDLENRDQTIASLRKKIAEKDQEINKLRDADLTKDALISKLRSKSRESDQDSRSEYSGARAPTNVSLRLELQKKDDQIDELQRQLERAQRNKSPIGRDDSSDVQRAQRVEVRRRPILNKFDHLNREELLYELEMALQDNEGLIQQLAKRSPNITELHNQLLDIRKELARQKYVNQVLWRKLDALIDIQGSNTRAELAIELANYHDELEALKAKQHRVNDARAAINNPISRSSSETSLTKKDSGVESVIESTRYTISQQQEYQRQLNDKDDQIKQLTRQIHDLKKVHENELNQYRLKLEKAQTDLVDDLNSKQDDLRQARSQIELLKSTKTQLEQAQDQNQRLHNEIKSLQSEISSKNDLIIHYEKQMSVLEKQVSARGGGTGEMSIRTSEMSELLEEMRRLRHDLERSINKQNELQAKLDENIRSSRTPREFTFSGRGLSYPDLRIVDASGLIGTENISVTSIIDEKRSRPLGSSTTELDIEQIPPTKMYIVGETDTHENLRRLIADLRIELKGLEVKIKEKLRSKFTSSLTEPSIEWLEHRLKTVTLCLTRLEEAYQLIELYWKANLPIKNKYDEHPFNDLRLANENRELRISQTKYLQELQNIKQKYKEQSTYMDQVLAQLTKANNKKANADDYLALLLRPTLDVLQKARSNMEHHLKEDNNQILRRQRSNRLD